MLLGKKSYFWYTPFNEDIFFRNESGDKHLHAVILSDSDLLELPLEAMTIFDQKHVTSVSRDFSLQMFYYRMLMFNVNEEG